MIRVWGLTAVLFLIAEGFVFSADGPLPPQQAAESLKLPDGFNATLFAGEPDVVQPMSITFDDRGRMWVVECKSYPAWHPAGTKQGSDRILILEDTDGDGQANKQTVFFDKGVNFSSVEYGFGGVFVTAIPQLIFIPDANHDDVPDGPPQVLLDGFDLNAKHNVANGLVWGPDGWLYGCNGILSNSRVGKPGSTDAQRVPINCGIWRYHPVRHEFEAVAHGTTNPWGLAFDERGEGFLTNCVIEHAFHVVPGARFKRMFGQDFNPKTFELMQTCADHIHWAGGTWEGSRNATGKHGEAGGGHAHSGAMIYLGDQFPAEYRNCLFTLNIHGQRLNCDKLVRSGSGYVAKHMPDFAPSGDPWFRGVCVRQGLDGSIYFTDWSDTGECHNYEDATIHRENGRIYKVKYGAKTIAPIDFAKRSDSDLIRSLSDADCQRASMAGRVLQERAAEGKLASDSAKLLMDQYVTLKSSQPITGRDNTSASRPGLLQTLWALHSTNSIKDSDAFFADGLLHPDDTVRGWMVRLAVERKPNTGTLQVLSDVAARETSAYVRLQLASVLQRMPLADRKRIATALVAHAEDASDNNLALMVWYGIEPLVNQADDEVLSLALATKIPKVRQFIARSLATGSSVRFAPLLRWLEEQPSDLTIQRDVLTGLHTAIEGRRDLKPDQGWKAVSPRFAMSGDAVVRELGHRISLIQGSDADFDYFAQVVKNEKLDAPQRERALADLVVTRRPTVADLLLDRLNDKTLRASAIRGLAGFDRAEVSERILSQYGMLSDAEKLDAISTLAAREKTAYALVSAVDSGKIGKQDLSEFDIRQLQRFKDSKLKALVNKLFGAKPSSAERAKQIAEMKEKVLAGDTKSGRAGRGRAIFQRNCATCHTLFGEGRQVGPDLTGAQRTDLDYVLINIMDPSALVGHAYRVTVVELKDGRVINGIVKAEDANTITLQTATDRVVVATQDIEDRQQQPVSMMPEGLLNRLTIEDIRDLVKYLGSPEQVPLE